MQVFRMDRDWTNTYGWIDWNILSRFFAISGYKLTFVLRRHLDPKDNGQYDQGYHCAGTGDQILFSLQYAHTPPIRIRWRWWFVNIFGCKIQKYKRNLLEQMRLMFVVFKHFKVCVCRQVHMYPCMYLRGINVCMYMERGVNEMIQTLDQLLK